MKRGEDGVFGTEMFLGYCGGSRHQIPSFVITLVSLFIRLSEEVTWVERRFLLISENPIKNILNSLVISVLFFDFENKFSIFSRKIHLEEKTIISPEAEDSSGSRKCFGFNFHKIVQEQIPFIWLGRVNSGCFRIHFSKIFFFKIIF